MPIDEPTLDLERFESLMGPRSPGQPDVIEELSGFFASDVHTWLIAGHEAAASGDLAKLRRVAHSLKGCCGTLGAERMRSLAIQLESALDADQSTDGWRLIGALTEEFQRVKDGLRAYVSSRRGGPRDEPPDLRGTV